MIKKIFVLIAILFAGLSMYAQNNTQDVVYLKNGRILKGVIIEQVPGVSLKIQTADGSVFVYPIEEVEKMAKETPTVQSQQQTNSNFSTKNPIKPKYKVSSRKSPFAAGLLSFFIPGAGQLYATDFQTGWGYVAWALLGYPALVSTTYLLFDYDTATIMTLIFSIAQFAFNIEGIVDAVSLAKKVNLENGYLSMKINDKVSLGVRPELSYNNIMQQNGGMSPTFTKGIGFSLSF